MNEQDNNSRKKKTGKSGWIIAVVVIFLLNMLGSRGAFAGIIVTLFIVGAVVSAAFLVLKAVKKEQAATGGAEKADRPFKSSISQMQFRQDGDRPAPAPRPAPVSPSSGGVSENRRQYYDNDTAMQNFDRDRQRRLAQLDDFLKNGIITREEYKLLHARYSKDA